MSTDTDEPSNQLQGDLRQCIASAHAARRPILTHLNADTTWLLSIPYPLHTERPVGRCRFNILVDPWFTGPQSDVASWFSTQWHVIKSSVQSVAELDALLREAEDVELEAVYHEDVVNSRHPHKTYIDLIAISHEFTDHCHKNTLLEVDQHVPVLAAAEAVKLISSWAHFETVVELPAFVKDCDWRTTSKSALPKWLGVSRLTTPDNALYYHSAIIICIQQSESEDAEAVIYTPHGVHADTFSALKSAKPTVSALALLHGLHDVSITLTKQLNLGAHNALTAQRLLQAKYWVGTHDEVKKGGGLLAPFLRRKAHTVNDALSYEVLSAIQSNEKDKGPLPQVTYSDLASGESLLLK